MSASDELQTELSPTEASSPTMSSSQMMTNLTNVNHNHAVNPVYLDNTQWTPIGFYGSFRSSTHHPYQNMAPIDGLLPPFHVSSNEDVIKSYSLSDDPVTNG